MALLNSSIGCFKVTATLNGHMGHMFVVFNSEYANVMCPACTALVCTGSIDGCCLKPTLGKRSFNPTGCSELATDHLRCYSITFCHATSRIGVFQRTPRKTVIMLWLASTAGIIILKPSAEMPPVKIISTRANKDGLTLLLGSFAKHLRMASDQLKFIGDGTCKKKPDTLEPRMRLPVYPHQVVTTASTSQPLFTTWTTCNSSSKNLSWKLKQSLSLSVLIMLVDVHQLLCF